MTTPSLQELRREYKAFNKKEIVYDIYCDRVNFIGFNNTPLNMFCDRHGIIINPDRGGYSIDLKDAKKIGLPMEKQTNVIKCTDLRKKGY